MDALDVAASAGDLAQTGEVGDLHLAAAETGESFRLQTTGGGVYTGPLDTQHGAKIGLGQRKRRAIGAAVKPHQPFGQSFDDEMGGIASGFLCKRVATTGRLTRYQPGQPLKAHYVDYALHRHLGDEGVNQGARHGMRRVRVHSVFPTMDGARHYGGDADAVLPRGQSQDARENKMEVARLGGDLPRHQVNQSAFRIRHSLRSWRQGLKDRMIIQVQTWPRLGPIKRRDSERIPHVLLLDVSDTAWGKCLALTWVRRMQHSPVFVGVA